MKIVDMSKKVIWKIIRFFLYIIILGSITAMLPETIGWTGTLLLILEIVELVVLLRKPKRVVELQKELEDYD